MSDTGKKKNGFPFWALFLIDILIAGLLLLIFAYFHHGRNYLRMKRELAREQAEVRSAEAEEGASANNLTESFSMSGEMYSLSYGCRPDEIPLSL